jgi:dipeptidyl aminopeptidase/acylaminoacyl peptidase
VARNRHLIVPLSMLALLAAALACVPNGTATPGATPTGPLAEPPTLPLPVATQTTAPSPTQLPLPPEGTLTSTGPWLVFATYEEVYALNPDGSGLTQLLTGWDAYPHNDLASAVAPRGGHLAYVTSPDGGLHGLTLHILSFPAAETPVAIALTTPSTEPGPEDMNGDPAYEAMMALTSVPSFAWSPGGQSLAFVGTIEGPTSDLYLYSLEDGTTTRLSSGPSQAFNPAWSPDGQFIFHAGARSFGTGAGYTIAGAWVTGADGSGIVAHPGLGLNGEVHVAGWTADNRVVTFGMSASCGWRSLAAMDVLSGTGEWLWRDFFRDVSLDPDTGNLLLAVDSDSATYCNTDPRSGLFLIRSEGDFDYLADTEALRVMWSPEAQVFFALTSDRVLAFTAEGQPLAVPFLRSASDLPAASPDGQLLAFMRPNGVWIASLADPEAPPRLVAPGEGGSLTWTPDGQAIFFTSSEILYRAQAPDFTPVPVAPGLFVLSDFRWALP